jgi:uncharacterized protein (TIGR03086 family)
MTTQPIDLDLLERCYRTTGEVLDAIPADRWDAPSPCTEWTVRGVADHLVEALALIAGAVSGKPVESTSFGEVTRRCLAAFADPEALAAVHPSPAGPLTGRRMADISLSESLVHGWDLATGAGLRYEPDPEAVAVVAGFPDGPRAPGMYADPVPVPADAPAFVALLGRLGRAA